VSASAVLVVVLTIIEITCGQGMRHYVSEVVEHDTQHTGQIISHAAGLFGVGLGSSWPWHDSFDVGLALALLLLKCALKLSVLLHENSFQSFIESITI